LEQYEKDLLYAVEHHAGETHMLLLRPVPSIPGLVVGSWSESETQAMRDNRKQAQEIYDRISARLPNTGVHPTRAGVGSKSIIRFAALAGDASRWVAPL